MMIERILNELESIKNDIMTINNRLNLLEKKQKSKETAKKDDLNLENAKKMNQAIKTNNPLRYIK